MKRLLQFLLLLFLVSGIGTAGSGIAEAAESGNNGIGEQVSRMQERMMNDEEVMSLILALQEDPEMRALLNDQSVMNAVNSGDIDALTRNPSFMRLFENARVKEIRKRMEQ